MAAAWKLLPRPEVCPIADGSPSVFCEAVAMIRRRRSARVFAQVTVSALWLCASSSVAASDVKLPEGLHVSLFAGVQHFVWEEMLSGETLVKEKGPMLSLGASADNFDRLGKGVVFGVEAALYGGTIDYDGQTQDGIEFNTESEYLGAYLDGLAGYRVYSRLDRFGLDLLGGLAVDAWSRDIQSGNDVLGRQVTGLAEDYRVFSGKLALGFHGRWQRWTGYLQTGVKRPFDAREEVSQPGVTLKPKGAPSAFGRVSLDRLGADGRRTFGFVLYYDSYRFDESPAELGSLGGDPVAVFQPESHVDVVGLRIRYAL